VPANENGDVLIDPALRSTSVDDLISTIYSAVHPWLPIPPPSYFSERMILAPRNTDVDDINKEVMDRLAGASKTYLSANLPLMHDRISSVHDSTPCLPVEFIQSLPCAGMPPAKLKLKVGCPALLM